MLSLIFSDSKAPTVLLICLDVLNLCLYSVDIMQPRTDPLNVLYAVYETNADFECVNLVHSGFVRDIAESIAAKTFVRSERLKDFMVLNRDTNEMVSHCLSDRTKQLRNECQG